MVQMIPPERLAEVQRDLRKQLTEATPDVANVQNALHLAQPEVLHFRGRAYLIQPVSTMDGLELMRLTGEMDAAAARVKEETGEGHPSKAAWVAYACAYRDVIELVGRLMRPGGWRGALWLLRPNPFRAATFMEVRDAIRFFAQLQTKSSVRYRFQESESGAKPISLN